MRRKWVGWNLDGFWSSPDRIDSICGVKLGQRHCVTRGLQTAKTGVTALWSVRWDERCQKHLADEHEGEAKTDKV